jgi:hypothetical protein
MPNEYDLSFPEMQAINQQLLELQGGVLPQQQLPPVEWQEDWVPASEHGRIRQELETAVEINLQLAASRDTAEAQLATANNDLAAQKALALDMQDSQQPARQTDQYRLPVRNHDLQVLC